MPGADLGRLSDRPQERKSLYLPVLSANDHYLMIF